MGSLSYINEARNPEDFQRRWPLHKRLSYLAAEVCNMQMDAGRFFLAEHPDSSRQWRLPPWRKLINRKGVHMVKGDQCVHGLVCPEGHPLQKRTVFLSNSLMLVQPLAKLCKGKHKKPHRKIEGSVKGHRLSTWSQAWPKRLCSLIAGQIMRLRSAQQTYAATKTTQKTKWECKACKGQNALTQ